MSLTQSSGLVPYTEIIPDNLRAGGLTKASSVVERRRIRVVPQGAASYASAGNQQIQFLIAGDGMLDCRSAVLNFTIQTTGSNCAPDDFGIFGVQQTILNGNVVENLTNCAKVANANFRTGVSKSFLQTAGSFMGAQLLNNDLEMSTPVASAVLLSSYGNVSQNQPGVAARAQRVSGATSLGNNSLGGINYSVPLSVIGDFWKCQQALPLGILGEINLTIVTNSAVQALFSAETVPTSPDYALYNINLTYDVLVPSNDLMMLYKQVAMDPNDAGLNYVVESTICTQAGNIGTTASAATGLSEYVAIASRSTNNLVRSSLLLVNSAPAASVQYPSQSCFSWANTYSVQWRIGSMTFPQLTPAGPADLFTMTLNSVGSTTVEHGSAINYLMWANSTDAETLATSTTYASASVCTTNKFTYADSFIPTMNFKQILGGYEQPSLQGVSLSGNSGSQLIAAFVSAPPTSYQVFLTVTALKVIKAQGGGVRVEGP
jgi:hypothetical protein